MIVNSQTNPSDETWSWDACTPDLSTCRPFAQGRVVSTAGAPPKTAFLATSSYGAVAVSPVWRGRLAITRPPSVRGLVRANQLVTPVAGKWKGGWSGSEDWFQLSACERPRGRGCTTLTDMHYVHGCPNFAAVLEPEFAGWYLRVADMRVGQDSGILDYGVGSPYGRPVWKRSSQVAVAIVGKIAPASGPRTETCGTPPYGRPLRLGRGEPVKLAGARSVPSSTKACRRAGEARPPECGGRALTTSVSGARRCSGGASRAWP